jgi:hypothetical protein
LCEALTQANKKIWVDWNDIPPAEDWRQEIYRGIEAANNFVFIAANSIRQAYYFPETQKYKKTAVRRDKYLMFTRQ